MVVIAGETGTVLGPLTTVWVPPTTCTAILPLCATCDVGFQGQMCESRDDGLGHARDNTGCWPPVLSKVASPNPPFLGWGFYSPGLECPTGYTSACTADGYQCTNYYGNTCILVASTTTIAVETGSCSGNDFTGIELASFPDVITRTESLGGDSSNPPSAVQTVTELRTMTLLAPMFQINFQSTDLPGYTSTVSTTNTTTESSTTTQSSAETSASTAGASSGSEDSGLTTGAKIGVIVGSIAGGLVSLALVGWGLYKLRQLRSAAAQSSAATAPSAWGQPPQGQYHPMYPQQHSTEYHDHSGWVAAGPIEMDRGQGTPAELDRGHGMPAELDRGQGTPAEMSTYTDDSRGHSPYKPPGVDGTYYPYR
ncbi:hypothetical protein F5X68DRAFT_273224 [Plectosphaerella plurivora]|uniref:Uncharacterized protein n=1 Tax=Plectosphaerella plurivora TaxID=936078 RepID=A0A9P8VJ65_9PEZI|nr:hypothetical protein F5X68DRAFT_273224 [Plectosphaerella plurivora]